jgi:hypothetical protein
MAKPVVGLKMGGSGMLMSRRFRTLVSLILLPVMLSMTVVAILPEIAVAQSSTATTENACMDGQMSAKASVSGGLWFFAGCLGLIGLLAAYIVEPSPPASSLLGKSPEYVARYTDCFKQEAKSIQTKNAITGCLVIGLVEVVVYAVIVAAAVSTDDEYVY